jgi:hypothetical protein
MWEERKRERLQQLRERQSALNEAERDELAGLLKELEDAEAAYLGPATDHLRAEREIVEKQNRTLELLVRRRENLLHRLGDFLAEAKAERRAIERELDAVLAEAPPGETKG